MQYVGKKEVISVKEDLASNLETPTVVVDYVDGTSEILSKLMYDRIVSETSCDETELRNKRVVPVVEELLEVLRNWGIKLSELSYLSILLNTSLEENGKKAIIMLWSKYMPRPAAPDDVDLITVDRVLKEEKKTLKDIIQKQDT